MMYYPFVHPPRPVLWQALLYWDELTSISPEDGYRFGRDLMELRDLGLYRPSHADDLPQKARAALISDLFQVVERTPGEALVPVPGPLAPDNRLYWGKLPYMVEQDLIELGALIPQDGMLRASPTLLAQLMIVLAKHLAAATGNYSVYRIARRQSDCLRTDRTRSRPSALLANADRSPIARANS